MSKPAQLTPASLLQILCIKNSTVPEYELISAVGQSHAPTFTFQVKVNDITVSAEGPSKQKAKHAAARILLEKLLTEVEGFKDGFEFEGTWITAENLHEFIHDQPHVPIEEILIGNPVGALQEICQKLKWLVPYYETISATGPPHDMNFHIACTVDGSPFPSDATAKTKKVAKRLAADNMLKYLDGKTIVDGQGSIEQFIAEWKGIRPDLIDRINEIDLYDIEVDFPRALHRLSIEKNCDLIFDVNYYPIDLKGLEGESYYALNVVEMPRVIESADEEEEEEEGRSEIYRAPIVCFICSDDSQVVARNKAARNFLNFLKHKLKEDEE